MFHNYIIGVAYNVLQLHFKAINQFKCVEYTEPMLQEGIGLHPFPLYKK